MNGRLSTPEPWRVKSIEPIRLASPEEREAALRRAGWNVFGLSSRDVFIDLLTDSGTGAMSAAQWAGIMMGDEAYAGSASWDRLESVVRRLTGYRHVLPVHQGRGAETVYTRALVREGDLVPGNLHFDTTGAHIRNRGAVPVDLVVPEGLDPESRSPFKGNVDLERVERLFREHRGRIRLFILTLTANSNGGQPVSLENARALAARCRAGGVRLLIDAARFAENAFLVREREPGQDRRSVEEIAREFFDLADGAAMSGKKDGLVNVGGFLALRDTEDLEACRPWGILYEGFRTYGGMAGRDLEAFAIGLEEGVDEEYLRARIRQVRFLHALLDEAGVPLVHPPGGHSVVIDAAAFLPHLSREQLPAESLAAALYLAGGVRGVGLGGLAFGSATGQGPETPPAPPEYLRLAIPHRRYTDNHLAYVAEVVESVWRKREEVPGLQTVRAPSELAHFTATFRPSDV